MLFFSLTAASAFAIKIEGAVISPSEVISVGKNKTIAHQDGGTISKLLVKNGDYVAQGAPLLELDGSAIKAEFNVMHFKQVELGAKIARLKATLDNKPDFQYTRLRTRVTDTAISQAIDTQENLFRASRKAFESNVATITERIEHYESEVDAIGMQITTTRQQLGVINEQLVEIAPLVQEQLVAKSREWQLSRDYIGAQSQLDSLNVTLVKTQSAINEARNELRLLSSSQREFLFDEIEKVQTELQAVEQSYTNLKISKERLVILAPVDGTIHNLQHNNAGDVIMPGDVIMELVPVALGQELLAKVQPVDIDQITHGQDVRLRFESFDANTTPEVTGRVTDISADSFMDANTGMNYYEVKISMDRDQIARLGNVEIVTGMPATTMFRTTDRSLFSYLTQPIAQQTTRAFH